jgi:integrase
MAKQRGHGEGSIYQRKDGRWVASVTLEGRRRKTFYGKTRREVAGKLQDALNEKKRGLLVTGPRETVGHYLEYWLEEVHKPTIRISTYVRYREIMQLHIVPSIGHLQLTSLSPQHIQTLYAQKMKEGLSASTVQSIHAVLHKALDNAVRLGSLSRNVSDRIPLPRIVKHEIKPLTLEQAQHLLKSVREHRLEALFALALATGMRLGELLGLRWQDIDFTAGSLQVRHILSYVRSQGFVESEPKTAKGKRRITLPAFMLDSLKQHRVRQLEAKLKAGSSWKDRDLVFCADRGGYLNPASTMQVVFKSVLKKAGLPQMRFHDLRHSAATILLSMGVHPKVVQELLGHSRISMTMDIYSHVLPTMQKDAMERMNDALQKKV